MVDEPSGEKSLEMRVAELEDKLAQVHITEEEIKAYQKVSGLLGAVAACGGGGWRAPAVPPCETAAAPPCIAAQQVQQPITQAIPQPITQPAITNWGPTYPIYQPILRCWITRCIGPIIRDCWAECGPGLPGNIPGGIGIPGQQFGQLGG